MRNLLRAVSLVAALSLGGIFNVSAQGPDKTGKNPAQPGAPVFSVLDYGAAGDGWAKDTRAIQQAVDAAAAAGWGTVYFPPGKYLSGTIFMKSTVTLSLEAGAVLLGSKEIADFPQVRPDFRSYTDNYVTQSLIYGEDLHDIALVGRGAIDGQGAAYPKKEYGGRPDVIRLVSCRNILVENITLTNSPMWMQHYLGCDFLTVRGIQVFNHATYNNDMIDIDCCRNVRITDCYGNSDDDALTLKSTAGRPTENVTITNCVLGSGCNAIKMGTESNGGFKNISITNCVIDSRYDKKGFYGDVQGSSGISVEIVDGGTLENVTISNITMKGVQAPLFLRLGNRARPFKPDMEKPGMGSYRNVLISNIIATEVGRYACSILGLPGHPIRNVTLRGIRMTFPGGGTAEEAAQVVPERADEYPDANTFGNLPAWGLYCRHVEGLRLSDIDIRVESADQRPAMIFEDVKNLDLAGFSEERGEAAQAPTLVLRDVGGALLSACRPDPGSRAFLRLEGGTVRVSVTGSDLSLIGKAFEFGEGVSQGVLFQAANLEKK